MLHKHFKRARRHWNVVAEDPASFADPSCDRIIAMWARQFADPLIEEVQRLRTELKRINRKRRGVYADLREEEDEFDRIVAAIGDVLGGLPADPAQSVSSYSITEQLCAILGEFADDD